MQLLLYPITAVAFASFNQVTNVNCCINESYANCIGLCAVIGDYVKLIELIHGSSSTVGAVS